MGLGQPAGAVVGTYVPVDVEEPDRVRVRGEVVAGQAGHQLPGFALSGQLAEFAADGGDLGSPIERQDPAQVARDDPGRALRTWLTQQREEHQGEQHRLEAVEAALELAVHLPGDLEQPGGLQCRQAEQQPGQRQLPTLGEHRHGLAKLPVPGRLALAGTRRWGRHHRQPVHLIRPGRLGRSRPGPLGQHLTDRERRHPGPLGDLGLGQPLGVQRDDLSDDLVGELPRPLRAGLGWHQTSDAVTVVVPAPPPQRGRGRVERCGDLDPGRDLAGRELHRGDAPARLVTVLPRPPQRPPHKHGPTGLTDQEPRGVPDRDSPLGQQRKRCLCGHRRHPATIPRS